VSIEVIADLATVVKITCDQQVAGVVEEKQYARLSTELEHREIVLPNV
jgi:hypothetical protein